MMAALRGQQCHLRQQPDSSSSIHQKMDGWRVGQREMVSGPLMMAAQHGVSKLYQCHLTALDAALLVIYQASRMNFTGEYPTPS
jgi:hypothetical protein